MAKRQQKTDREKAVEAALALAAEKGWETTTLHDIAEKSGISLSVLHDLFEYRLDILAAYGRIVDRQVLEGWAADPESTPRDRLFDLIMARFEVIDRHREGVKSILRSMTADPKQAVIGLPHLGRSMVWMLEATGIGTVGLRGAARVAGLTGIYLQTLRVWRDDDSVDLAKTMAALDRYLERAEHWAGRFGFDS